MLKRVLTLSAVVGILAVAVLTSQGTAEPAKPDLPAMKFTDVREIAPGVFFRYSSISATDKSIPFGGCNNTWIVFKDHVVVIDANFPKEAGDVIEAIKKTTNKPIRFVLDTHHHGDHAYGNCIWAKAGARIIASKPTFRLLESNSPKQWEDAAKDRKDIKENELKKADISFDDKYVLEDDTQRVELLHFGHAHTAGDAVAYLPKYKILCTGDACVNGSFNFMGHANSASWIKRLDDMKKLDVDVICPGHGSLAYKDLLDRQQRYFLELRENVQKGIDAKKTADEIAAGLDMAWYKEWTGKAAKDNVDNVKHVFAELTGKIQHDRLGMAAPLDYWTPTGLAGVAGRRFVGRVESARPDVRYQLPVDE